MIRLKDMKKLKNITILATIAMVLTGGFTSCEKKEGGNVPFKPCPCENKPFGTIKGKTRLFFYDDFKGLAFDERMEVFRDDYIRLIFYTLDGSPPPKGGFKGPPTEGFICNFPDFAREWRKPEGISVYYEGILYPWCDEGQGGRQDRGFANLMLTKLIIK